MTITLSWWAFPLLLAVTAVLLFWRGAVRNSANRVGWALICFFVAGGFTGGYLSAPGGGFV